MNGCSHASGRPANRLGREKSPYLLQHARNPVDWYPWGEEALARARDQHKPIFLSIGYSTCHWCHVMERESFENEEIARLLNQHFVSVKVDREERPDVDRIYMAFVQATTGYGGWPMTVFLTPNLQPFFGGTYFPPEDRAGYPGLRRILMRIAELWAGDRAALESKAGEIFDHLKRALTHEPAPRSAPALTSELLMHAARTLKAMADRVNGGFGSAPKFPQPSLVRFLIAHAVRFKDAEAARLALLTCDRMAAGGLHDHVGGGFARYAVDAEWRIPHFEKMLYDNAQLAQLYLDAALLSGDARHAATARGILDYVLRDLTHPEGGFYSAEDADSEGHEGKFYCWTRTELQALLTTAEFELIRRRFGVSEEGNFVDHSHPRPLGGQNVLCVADAALAQSEVPLLDSALMRMRAARSRRVRPALDDKVLASWNGLMLGAMARAGIVLGAPAYLEAAARNLSFIQTRLWDKRTCTLHNRWRDGERDAVQLLDAYAFVLGGVVDLYEAALNESHLEFALALAESMIERFCDEQHGSFWLTVANAPDLIMRLKDDYDGAEPAGGSVAVLALLKLAVITGRTRFRLAAERSLQADASRLWQMPQALPFRMQAVHLAVEEPCRIILAGDLDTAAASALLQAAHRVCLPNRIVLGNRGLVDGFAQTLPVAGPATAYVCKGTACQAPTSDPAVLTKMMTG